VASDGGELFPGRSRLEERFDVKPARDLVDRHFGALLDQAERERIPSDVVGRLVLEKVIALWLENRSTEDVANELRFAIDNLAGDQDFPFMRP
jgi:hypothetical protein